MLLRENLHIGRSKVKSPTVARSLKIAEMLLGAQVTTYMYSDSV